MSQPSDAFYAALWVLVAVVTEIKGKETSCLVFFVYILEIGSQFRNFTYVALIAIFTRSLCLYELFIVWALSENIIAGIIIGPSPSFSYIAKLFYHYSRCDEGCHNVSLKYS